MLAAMISAPTNAVVANTESPHHHPGQRQLRRTPSKMAKKISTSTITTAATNSCDYEYEPAETTLYVTCCCDDDISACTSPTFVSSTVHEDYHRRTEQTTPPHASERSAMTVTRGVDRAPSLPLTSRRRRANNEESSGNPNWHCTGSNHSSPMAIQQQQLPPKIDPKHLVQVIRTMELMQQENVVAVNAAVAAKNMDGSSHHSSRGGRSHPPRRRAPPRRSISNAL